MSRPWEWPAFAGVAPGRLPRWLEAERGIWGKVHGARSDFRWIAASRGFATLGRDLERELAVGIEDRPARFPLWRAAPGVHLAGTCYPSRARDAAGRGGALEKQLLAWRTDPSVPAALAALVLLPRAAELDDRDWWDRGGFSAWNDDPRFVLDLGEPREIPVSEEDVASAMSDGISSLRAALGVAGDAESALAALYAGLLDGRRPVLFAAGGAPIAPEALTALLLPLDRERADRLSLAGWLPSSRPPREELGERWDVVALPGETAREGGSRAPDPRASRMAAALLAGDPRLIGDIRAPVGAVVSGPPQPATGAPWGGDGSLGPAPALEERSDRPALPVPPSLPEPPAGASRAWWILHDLARDPNRFWLDPRDLAPHLVGSEEEDDGTAFQTAVTWLRILAGCRPPGTAGEQHRAKEDLLRAAILALSPTAATLEALEPFQSDRVPPLLYLADLPPGAWDLACCTLGEPRVAELARRSRERCAPELRPRMEGWLDRR